MLFVHCPVPLADIPANRFDVCLVPTNETPACLRAGVSQRAEGHRIGGMDVLTCYQMRVKTATSADRILSLSGPRLRHAQKAGATL